MIITSDLKWNTHISSTCAKARQQLGFLYCFFYMAGSACLSHLYKCLVLPTLDYCSSVWDPAAVTLISQLESVQRFAARLVTKHWSSPPDQLIHSLNWPTLQARRRKQKVMVCRCILSGHSILPPSLLIPHPNPNPRRHHSYPLATLSPEHPYINHLFFISCTHLWNCLPDSIVCAPSTLSFKRKLKSALLPF